MGYGPGMRRGAPYGGFGGYGPAAAPVSKENRKEMLKEQAEALEEQLDYLKREMDALDEEHSE